MWRSLSIAGLGVTLLSLNSAAQPAAPPMTQSPGYDRDGPGGNEQADMSCRRSAASRSGYTTQSSGSKTEQRYAADYYACMNGQDGAPPPDDYAYGAPPPAAGYAYGAPPAYPYVPYPAPNYYPPSYYGPDYYGPGYYAPGYYGPDISLGFGFGGGHGGGGRRR